MSSLMLRTKRNFQAYNTDLQEHHRISGCNMSLLKNEIESFNFNENNLDIENENVEILNKLQILYPETNILEIKNLLFDNKNDIISVMNILKEKNYLNKRKKKKEEVKKNVAETRARLKQKFMQRKKNMQNIKNTNNESNLQNNLDNQEKKSEDNLKIQTECSELVIPNKQIQTPKKDWNVLIQEILNCKSPIEVQNLIKTFSVECEKELQLVTRYKAENYILKKGILQRKEITKEEIRKRMQLEEKVRQLENENYVLRNLQKSNENNWKNNWQNNHFAKQSDF